MPPWPPPPPHPGSPHPGMAGRRRPAPHPPGMPEKNDTNTKCARAKQGTPVRGVSGVCVYGEGAHTQGPFWPQYTGTTRPSPVRELAVSQGHIRPITCGVPCGYPPIELSGAGSYEEL